MLNKEITTAGFFILLAAHIGSIIYGFVKMAQSKKNIPLGAKVIFGLMFFGIPFVGPMAFILLEKNWEELTQTKGEITKK